VTPDPSRPDRDAVQRRTLVVLVISQVLGGVGIAIGFAVGALLAQDLSGSAGLAGLALTMALLGAALAVVPISRVSASRGRRVGLSLGYGIGAGGAAVIVLAAAVSSYALFLVGMVLFGGCMAAGFQARFAALDLARPDRHGRALSLVVWATTVGAVTGPNFAAPAGQAAEVLGLRPLAGPFLWSTGVLLAGAAVLFVLLRPDPLLVARAGSADSAGSAGAPHASLRTSFSAVRRSPEATYGLLAIAAAHGVMLAVMTMTPVHMHDGGAALRIVGLVISIHIAGMYAFAPLIGWVSDRFGRVRTAGLGAGVLAVSLGLAGTADAHDTRQLTAALFLLGLGWSFALIAGSTLLGQGVAEAVRPGVQGAADFVMQGSGAVGSALGGLLVWLSGYPLLAVVAAIPVVASGVGAVLLLRGARVATSVPR
jgi:MFS family permease